MADSGGTPVTLLVPAVRPETPTTTHTSPPPPRAHLPFTGFELLPLLMTAALLLAVGLLLLLPGRRRAHLHRRNRCPA